jgi:O-succinylhomoserine sulfhydrylase
VRAAVDKSQYGENSEALFLTSSFVQPDSETAARRFGGEEDGYIYSRFTNPTVASMEQRLAALEGAEACIGTSSGMSAVLLLCMGLLKSGDHVVCSRSVFGSTLKLIGSEFGKFGVQTTFVSQTDADEWRRAVQSNTRLLFAETPTNPCWPTSRTTRAPCWPWTTAFARRPCSAPSTWAPTSWCTPAPSTWTDRGGWWLVPCAPATP